MPLARKQYSRSPESLLVGLARNGDRRAYEELVRQRQTWIRNLMRRFSGDVTLADDLAQQVFLQGWRNIRHLQRRGRFGAWLKRIAINVWLQYLRKKDPLRHADEHSGDQGAQQEVTGIGMDLDRALAALPEDVRLCIVLSYYEGMNHSEITEYTNLPLGTVKSHIRRGTKRLRASLSAYTAPPGEEVMT